MKAGFIGINGYIGSHLADYLTKKGWQITGADIHAGSQVECKDYVQLDVRDTSAIDRRLLDADFLFYFSGITGTKQFEDYSKYIQVNEMGLVNILEQVRHSAFRPRIVFPSTRLVYKGVKETFLPENAEKEFKTMYAVNKWFGEKLLEQYALYFNLDHTIFRICVPYGKWLPGEYSYGTVGFFLKNALSGKPLSMYGDGSQRRTFTHITDLCGQVEAALKNATSINQVYNIGGENLSLREMAGLFADRYKVPVQEMAWPELDLKLESGDTIFDWTKLQRLTGYTLVHKFDSWVRDL